jgi:hypothetical protein
MQTGKISRVILNMLWPPVDNGTSRSGVDRIPYDGLILLTPQARIVRNNAKVVRRALGVFLKYLLKPLIDKFIVLRSGMLLFTV